MRFAKQKPKKKSKVTRHHGFSVLYDIIQPQLKKRFKATRPRNVTEIVPGHFLLVATMDRRDFIFRVFKKIVIEVGLLPPDVEWGVMVGLEKEGNLCPESILCLAQGIKFDPSAKIL